MKFVFFGFGEWRKWTRWWRGWWGNAPSQNFWARTAPAGCSSSSESINLQFISLVPSSVFSCFSSLCTCQFIIFFLCTLTSHLPPTLRCFTSRVKRTFQQLRKVMWTRKGLCATVVTAGHGTHAELTSGHALDSCYSCCVHSLPGLCELIR